MVVLHGEDVTMDNTNNSATETLLIPTAHGIYHGVRYHGQGSFGRVFRGIRAKDGIEVAIKELNLNLLGKTFPNEEERSNFRESAEREYSLMAESKHPNLVQVFDYYTEGNVIHVIMEFCDFQTVKEVIDSRSGVPFPESTAWLWTGHLARGLNYLHEKRRMLHRNVRADNAFLSQGGSVAKLGKFGISKELERMCQSSERKSSLKILDHCPPEVFQENFNFTAKSEIWTLGIVFHHIAALTIPFTAAEASLIILEIIRNKPQPLSGDGYSKELETFCHGRLLNSDPGQRPTAAEILQHPRIKNALSKRQ